MEGCISIKFLKYEDRLKMYVSELSFLKGNVCKISNLVKVKNQAYLIKI